MGNTVAPVQPMLLDLIVLAKALLLPLMFATFAGALLLRALIYYTVRREETFAIEFEKRVNLFLESDGHRGSRSFFVLAKKLLERTYYEMFEVRAQRMKRALDPIMVPSDRVFLVRQGMAHLVRDTLREIKFVKYENGKPPLLELVKSTFANNPCFNRVFGVLPVGPFNELLNQIPGLFIVAGIFGTFLGIMQALPELGAMDLRDPESTKLVMDTFLAKIAFSMSTSTIGIFLSVANTVYNNFVSPERLFLRTVNRFERNLFRLWNRCDSNALPDEIPGFDEHRDPSEALASASVDRDLSSGKRNPRSGGAPPPLPPNDQAA